MSHDAKLAAVIDHTLLDPSADISAITQAVNIVNTQLTNRHEVTDERKTGPQ